MSLSIAIINGPNLNLLGEREPEWYGSASFEEYLSQLRQWFSEINISYFQSNVEGELINFLHQCREQMNGVILNAGAYTHTSIALADAIAATRLKVIEVHISNVFAREEFRRTSFIASKCVGSISGLGLDSYRLAIEWFQRHLAPETL